MICPFVIFQLLICCVFFRFSSKIFLKKNFTPKTSAYLTKPASSKAGNSELYLVMLNYCGLIAPLDNTSHFLHQTLPIVSFFAQRQERAIEANLSFKSILTADTLKQVELESEIEISTQNMMNQFQNITLGNEFFTIYLRKWWGTCSSSTQHFWGKFCLFFGERIAKNSGQNLG